MKHTKVVECGMWNTFTESTSVWFLACVVCVVCGCVSGQSRRVEEKATRGGARLPAEDGGARAFGVGVVVAVLRQHFGPAGDVVDPLKVGHIVGRPVALAGQHMPVAAQSMTQQQHRAFKKVSAKDLEG